MPAMATTTTTTTRACLAKRGDARARAKVRSGGTGFGRNRNRTWIRVEARAESGDGATEKLSRGLFSECGAVRRGRGVGARGASVSAALADGFGELPPGDDGSEGTPSISAGPREDLEGLFGADYGGDDLSSQGDAVVKGVSAVADKPSGLAIDLDYLQELIAIQEDCPKNIGFFGTRNMGFMHQQLIEILSYALCLTGNHIFTSGATGTNAAVIRGALRAEKPELLTVVLPQSLARQPRESRELLEPVKQIIEAPENDEMSLLEASRICNDEIVSRVKQVIVFAFHDSRLLLETCRDAKAAKKLVTLFYLD